MDLKEESKIMVKKAITTKVFIEHLKGANQLANNFSKEESDVFIFCFLLIGFLEKAIEATLYDSLLASQIPKFKHPKLINLITKEMTFGTKIDVFEFIIKEGKKEDWENHKKFIKFCREINYGIRNNLFHFKIAELKYRNEDVRKIEIQVKIIRDFVLIQKKLIKYIEEHYIDIK